MADTSILKVLGLPVYRESLLGVSSAIDLVTIRSDLIIRYSYKAGLADSAFRIAHLYHASDRYERGKDNSICGAFANLAIWDEDIRESEALESRRGQVQESDREATEKGSHLQRQHLLRLSRIVHGILQRRPLVRQQHLLRLSHRPRRLLPQRRLLLRRVLLFLLPLPNPFTLLLPQTVPRPNKSARHHPAALVPAQARILRPQCFLVLVAT